MAILAKHSISNEKKTGHKANPPRRVGGQLVLYAKGSVLFSCHKTHFMIIVSNAKPANTKPMLIHCWPRVADDGPALNQHWFSVSCLQGMNFNMCNKI